MVLITQIFKYDSKLAKTFISVNNCFDISSVVPTSSEESSDLNQISFLINANFYLPSNPFNFGLRTYLFINLYKFVF